MRFVIKHFPIAMCRFFLFFSLLCSLFSRAAGQELSLPAQPPSGPGGADYRFETVQMLDFAEQADGYWLFQPEDPGDEKLPVVVFIHGYGAYNPMIYGQWLRHLVRKGNVVLFPRYQENIFQPRPSAFGANVAQAIRDAREELTNGQQIEVDWEKMAFIGHSYGGVIASDLAVNFESYEIPKALAAFLCSPGTGPLNGGRLSSYEEMPADLQLLMIVSENDPIVGDEFAKRVFETAVNVEQRNLLRQFPDRQGSERITAGHNETYSVDTLFDSGLRNYSSKKALRISKVDPVDYFGYWKLGDALLDCSRYGRHCEYAFGNTPEQRSLGLWSDGSPVRELEVTLPEIAKEKDSNQVKPKPSPDDSF